MNRKIKQNNIKKTKKNNNQNNTNTNTPTVLSTETQELLNNIQKLNTHIKQNNMTKIQKDYKNNKNNINYKQIFKNRSKKSFKHIYKNPLKNTYITTLVNNYYDNDKASNNYLNTAHKKIHMYPKQSRVIVFGDIHGDLEAALECFRLAGCINNVSLPKDKSLNNMNNFFKNLKWTGKDTYVVQLGDQIDRVRPQKWDHNEITQDSAYKDEGSTLEILYLFYYLNELAKKEDGHVFSIIGNHEIMNIEADFRYVSLKEFKCFKQHLKQTYHRHSKYPYNSNTLKNNSYKMAGFEKSSAKKQDLENTAFEKSRAKKQENDLETNNTNGEQFTKVPEGFRERLYAFSPTGLCANLIGANSFVVLQIGNWLFCHGSPVLNTIKKYNTDLINTIVSMYLLGIDNDDKYIEKHYNTIAKSKHSESILWNRDFGELEMNDDKDKELTDKLNTILDEYNKKNNHENTKNQVTHIAIGHTTQYSSNKGINSICDNRVWRCDVGMSRAFGHRTNEPYRQPQVLEILNLDGDGHEKINILI
jgi:hypothetical protein